MGGSVVDFAEYVNAAIQAGEVVEGNVVRVVADNGTQVGDAVVKSIQGGNGVASNVYVATQTGVSGAVATGLAYLAIDLGTAGIAIAAALGINTGFALYNITPEFWNEVGETLYATGRTIGGKVITYWNGENTYFDEGVVETFKNAFVNSGIFDGVAVKPDYASGDIITQLTGALINIPPIPPASDPMFHGSATEYSRFVAVHNALKAECPKAYGYRFYSAGSGGDDDVYALAFTQADCSGLINQIYDPNATYNIPAVGVEYYTSYGVLNRRVWGGLPNVVSIQSPDYYTLDDMPVINKTTSDYRTKITWNIAKEVNPSEFIQDGAILPNEETEFPETYPTWYPLEYPQTLPDPSELPTIYPLKYPLIEPDPYPLQDPAQNPDPESVPDIYPEIIPDFDLPQPSPDPDPQPDPDPDPQPDPDPLPDPSEPDTPNDPIDPNEDPPVSPLIPIPNLPNTVASSKLFTVYNPTDAQLDALGGYLWDGSIIAAIRDIWQEPLDGIISLIQVYATPPTSGSHNIILGFLDSGVSSAVVSNQFATIDCGTVSVNETKGNATDYSPYTTLHLYLPFIGFVELDTAECMNADISVKYKIDVYTGTCLATVSVDRDVDMPNDPILYTFSGNCSQQIPLTSGNATGMLSALIGGITAGLSVASGGGLGVLAGAQILGNSLTHEMFHISHSGNLSANAGIMGNKKPYLIIGRRHNYDANNYNSFYGYPTNKTVILGNHSGYVQIKKCWLKTSATQPEYIAIMQALEDGIIL